MLTCLSISHLLLLSLLLLLVVQAQTKHMREMSKLNFVFSFSISCIVSCIRYFNMVFIQSNMRVSKCFDDSSLEPDRA